MDDHENRSNKNRRRGRGHHKSTSRRIPNSKDIVHPGIVGNNLSFREQRQEVHTSREYREYRREGDRYAGEKSFRDAQDEILEDLENQLHELSDGPQGILLKPEGDMLDYVFESVENFVCRNKEDPNGYEGEDEKSITETESRLQKIPHKNHGHVTVMEDKRDILDYVFACADPGDLKSEMVRRPPRPVEDPTILVDRLVERGHEDEIQDQPRVDWKDVNVLLPMRLSQLPEGSWAYSRSNSNRLTDESCSSDEATEESRPIGRLEILRIKKRQLEARQQMVAEYMATESLGQTSKEMDHSEAQIAQGQVQHYESSRVAQVEMHPEGEHNRQARLTLLASILMFLLGTGFVVAAAVVFFPVL